MTGAAGGMVDMKALMQLVEHAESEVDAAAAAGQQRVTETDDEARYERELAQDNKALAHAALANDCSDIRALPAGEEKQKVEATNERSCAVCGKGMATPKVCAKCKAIAYCSRECQKSHWKAHKRSCAQLHQLREATGAKQLAGSGSGLSDKDLAAAAAAFAGGSTALRGTTTAIPAPPAALAADYDPNAFRDCAELFCKDLGLDMGKYESGALATGGVARGEEELEAMLDAEMSRGLAEQEQEQEQDVLDGQQDDAQQLQLLQTLLAAQQQQEPGQDR